MHDLFSVDPKSLDLVVTVLIKLGIGAVLAGLVGWERERRGGAAGIRTHMLIVVGVILFTEVSKAFAGADPSRIAAQILTGIGFLGAGTILRVGPEVKGLTTAASIWAVSAIGMAISLGGPFLVIALAATVLTLLTLAVVTKIEMKLFPNSHPSELLLTLREQTAVVAVIQALNEAGMRITQTQVLTTLPNVEMLLRVTGEREAILRTACGLPGVLSASWSN